MTLENILTLSKAGFTAQQIAGMEQPQMVQPQMVQPQMAQPQMVQPQMAQPQMVQPQMVQPQMAQPQMVQPQMVQPQMVQPQMAQPQMAKPQMAQPQMVQPQSGQYVPVLPQNNTMPQQNDPMKDVMLQNYMNAQAANMYNVHDVVADMIGANAPVDLQQVGGKK